MMSATQLEKLPVIGSQAIYHGSITDCHGRTYLLDSSKEVGRYDLLDLDGREDLENVRPESFTPVADDWWPSDAIEMDIAGRRFMAHHATYGGSRLARIVHYHTQSGVLAAIWCSFHEVTAEIRALDACR